MIKETDLRIGNYISKAGEVFKITSVGGGNIALSVDCFGCVLGHKLEECEGVVLTPELLEKAGFGKKKLFGVTEYMKNDFVIIKATFGEAEKFTVAENISGLQPRIEHVHTLQNLYYALTGKELEINL